MNTTLTREMTAEQQELLALCRRSYRQHGSEPEELQMEMLYPVFQPEHDRVLLVSGHSHPSIVAAAYFRRDGTPIHFEDWRSGESFHNLA